MLYKKQQYNPPTVYEYLDQKRKRKVIELQKQIANLDARMRKIIPAWMPVKTGYKKKRYSEFEKWR